MESSISASRAQQLVLASVLPTEVIQVEPRLAYRHALGTDLHALWDLPQADLSVMDGWAICTTNNAAKTLFHKRWESAAGHPLKAALAPGEAARVSTGAVIPAHANAVLAQEEIIDVGTQIRIPEQIARTLRPGRFIRSRGSDVRQGQLLLAAGKQLLAGELALLTGCGHSSLPIHRPPKVAILSSGDEIVPIGTTPSPAQVINSNGLMLAVQIIAAGGEVIDLGIVQDDATQILQTLQRGLEVADMLITSGGISVGDHDLIYDCLQQLGLHTIFRKVQMRPGKPTTFGRIGAVPIFALPGNPASSHVAFELFVRPAIRKSLGFPPPWLRPIRQAVLQEAITGEERREHYIRARVEQDQVTPLEQQSSGSLTSICGHNAFIIVPPGNHRFAPGSAVDVLLLSPEEL